ncbi:MAG TPA: WGR domain-containing protein [Kofleriaceae bacterium]|nr:WGR domain-containing protein [Kofleriaceae bacterium]
MSDWTVQLEFEEGTSSKFWRARVEGKKLFVNYGKIGTTGQTQVKDFSDHATALKEYDKLIKEKRKKGYTDSGGAGGGEEEDDEREEEEAEEEEAAEEEEEEERPKRKAGGKAAPAPEPARGKGGGGRAEPAEQGPPGLRLVLEAGSRRVETVLYLDGKSVRMDARESYASPEAAKKAYERLKKTLAGEGYRES